MMDVPQRHTHDSVLISIAIIVVIITFINSKVRVIVLIEGTDEFIIATNDLLFKSSRGRYIFLAPAPST